MKHVFVFLPARKCAKGEGENAWKRMGVSRPMGG